MKAEYNRKSKTGEEIKIGDYVIYGIDPRTTGWPVRETIKYMQRVKGFKIICGLTYPTFEIDKSRFKSGYAKDYNYVSEAYTIIKDANELIHPELVKAIEQSYSGQSDFSKTVINIKL